MDNSLKTEKIYTILELNNSVRRLIKDEFPEAIWVCGEIQDFKASKDKRHIYFNLAQKHPEADEIIAQVNAKIFESHKPQIFKRLQEIGLDFELKNDIEVKLKCEVDLYAKQGSFGLVVVDIDPIYTIGKIAQGRQRIIEDLRARGLLDKNKTLHIPDLPLRMGLITAYGSAAYRDVMDEFEKSRYGFKIIVYDCHMQGVYVEKDILSAFNFFNRLSLGELDVIMISRGGGSTADLSWFDNKKIAEAVATSNFPVISALGHEINITVTDLASNTSLKTPTKGAQFLIEKVREFIENVYNLQEQIALKIKDYIKSRKLELKDKASKIDRNVKEYFDFHKKDVITKERNVDNLVKNLLMLKRQEITRDFNLIRTHLNNTFKNCLNMVKYTEEKIQLLNPKNILKRGYSITFKNGKAVKTTDEVEENDFIRTVLYKGNLFSQVKKRESQNE
jgi:exodeoxyribonuclease VII large subunit